MGLLKFVAIILSSFVILISVGVIYGNSSYEEMDVATEMRIDELLPFPKDI